MIPVEITLITTNVDRPMSALLELLKAHQKGNDCKMFGQDSNCFLKSNNVTISFPAESFRKKSDYGLRIDREKNQLVSKLTDVNCNIPELDTFRIIDQDFIQIVKFYKTERALRYSRYLSTLIDNEGTITNIKIVSSNFGESVIRALISTSLVHILPLFSCYIDENFDIHDSLTIFRSIKITPLFTNVARFNKTYKITVNEDVRIKLATIGIVSASPDGFFVFQNREDYLAALFLAN